MNDKNGAQVEVKAGDAFAEDAAATKLRLLKAHGSKEVAVSISGSTGEVSVSFAAFLVVFSRQMKQAGGEVSVFDDGDLERGMRRLGVGEDIRWEK